MKKSLTEDLLKVSLIESYSSINFHQKLIDKWNDPTDIATRAAVLIRDVHLFYGNTIFAALQSMQNNCKHPKKMRDLCADGTVYCMVCNADLAEEDIMSVKTPTLMKQKITCRRKLVKKFTSQRMKQTEIAKKLEVSISTIEKDMVVLRN